MKNAWDLYEALSLPAAEDRFVINANLHKVAVSDCPCLYIYL